MEVDIAEPEPVAEPRARLAPPPVAEPAREEGTEETGRRGRRGRGRDRRERGARPEATEERESAVPAAPPAREPAPAPVAHEEQMTGERLTRDEALDLVRRAVLALTTSEDEPVPASAVRRKARELLGRDSETLNERYFHRILRDAHDADLIDLRKRGDDYEVAPAATAEPISEQLAAATPVAAPAPESSQAARVAAHAASLRRGIRQRGMRTSRPVELPPELLSVGVVEAPPVRTPAEPPAAAAPAAPTEEDAPRRGGRGRRAAKTSARRGRGKREPAAAESAPAEHAPAESTPAAAAPAPAAKKRRSRARKKSTAPTGGEG
jgi:ribonuclease E